MITRLPEHVKLSSCVDPEWLKAHPLTFVPKKKKSGYPAEPGTGPKGETCGTCDNLHSKEMYSGRVFYKCKILTPKWTGGAGTDVKLRSASCSYWKPKIEREKLP